MIAEPYINTGTGEIECGETDCERKAIGRGWCHMHYQRWHARNPVMNFREAIYQDNKKHNFYRIPLTQGMVAWVDPEWYDRLKENKWSLHSDGYAERRDEDNKCILMHRFITGAEENQIVDHIDGDKLNNRTCNLRLCTKSQNEVNKPKKTGTTSKYRGVCRIKGREGWWQAGIQKDGKRIALGEFRDEVAAARAYDQAARELFGQFSNPNFR